MIDKGRHEKNPDAMHFIWRQITCDISLMGPVNGQGSFWKVKQGRNEEIEEFACNIFLQKNISNAIMKILVGFILTVISWNFQ